MWRSYRLPHFFVMYKEKNLQIIYIFANKINEIRNLHSMKDFAGRMSIEQARQFSDDVLNIVAQIPRGKVTTYGIIAAWAGWPSHSRMVGRTLRYTPDAVELPCHRVVNIEGRTAPGWIRQRMLLEEEGVTFKSNGHVDMRKHLWQPIIDE